MLKTYRIACGSCELLIPARSEKHAVQTAVTIFNAVTYSKGSAEYYLQFEGGVPLTPLTIDELVN